MYSVQSTAIAKVAVLSTVYLDYMLKFRGKTPEKYLKAIKSVTFSFFYVNITINKVY